MSGGSRAWWKEAWAAPFFSAQGFVNRGIGLSVLFAACHLAGWREYTSFISGTSPTGAELDTTMALLGCAYFVTYSLVVLVVPVFLIGAVVFRVMWGRETGRAEDPAGTDRAA